jgi:hypothetical protein
MMILISMGARGLFRGIREFLDGFIWACLGGGLFTLILRVVVARMCPELLGYDAGMDEIKQAVRHFTSAFIADIILENAGVPLWLYT